MISLMGPEEYEDPNLWFHALNLKMVDSKFTATGVQKSLSRRRLITQRQNQSANFHNFNAIKSQPTIREY